MDEHIQSRQTNEFTQIILELNNGITTPFFFREGSSDDSVMKQIFIDKNYELNRLVRFYDIITEYRKIVASGKTPLIIDCGANIGASPVWFAKYFSNAKIIAIEPELQNYEILCTNCSPFHPNIICENAAVSCADEIVYLQDPGEGYWGFRTSLEAGQNGIAVSSVSIESIEKKFPDSELFLVKIDIEGGEERLFERNLDWIDRTMVIIIELHDWMFPKYANSHNFLKAIAGHRRDFIYLNENVFSIRNDR